MTTNVRFIWDNLADTATATADEEAGTLLIGNTQEDEKAAVWRSTTDGSQDIDYRWSAAQDIDSICFAWTNFTSAATIIVYGYSTEAGDTDLVFTSATTSPDTGLTIGNVTAQVWLTTNYSTIKHIRITIADAANPDGYLEVSRVCIGKRIEPVVNANQNGFTIGWKEQTRPVRAESLDLRVEPLGRYRWMRLNLTQLEAASRDLIVDMVAAGLGRGVWVSAFPEHSGASTRQLHSFWGALVQDVDMGYPNLDTWSAPLVFEEMA
jgi:hypothetical protein